LVEVEEFNEQHFYCPYWTPRSLVFFAILATRQQLRRLRHQNF